KRASTSPGLTVCPSMVVISATRPVTGAPMRAMRKRSKSIRPETRNTSLNGCVLAVPVLMRARMASSAITILGSICLAGSAADCGLSLQAVSAMQRIIRDEKETRREFMVGYLCEIGPADVRFRWLLYADQIGRQ